MFEGDSRMTFDTMDEYIPKQNAAERSILWFAQGDLGDYINVCHCFYLSVFLLITPLTF